MISERINWQLHAGNGPPCLMIHGALGSRSYWNENIEALGTLTTPVSIELWGHGSSPSPSDPKAYEPAGYIEQFERIRTELDAERVYVIGQSMGAALMLHYALTRPERVIALVLTNSSSAFSDPDAWRHRHATMVMDRARDVRQRGVESLRDTWLNPSRSRRIPERTRSVLAAEFDEHQTEGIARSFELTNRSLPLGDRLRQIVQPTLLTVGVDEERFLPLVEQARLIPRLVLADIEASHAVNAQNPEQWNEAVVDFLRLHRP
jgi:2-succinyl-6-hydroxy-2,4-cyclohexadiene-1-carboxylate synthase